MKKIILVAVLAICSQITFAQPPKGPAKTGNTYGEVIKADGEIALADLPAKLNNDEVIQTKVKARVLDVCPKKGCLISLLMPDSTKAFVKMKDYGFFVPVDLKGKNIVLDGEAAMKTISVEELQHYAEDAKK